MTSETPEPGQPGTPGEVPETEVGGRGGDGGRGGRGATGARGEQGERGEPGRSFLKLTDHRLLFIFVVTICVLAYFTQRSSSTADDASKALDSTNSIQHDQAVYQYNQCLRVQKNTSTLNKTMKAQIDILSSFVAPESKVSSELKKSFQPYIDLYKRSFLIVPECGEKP